MSDATPVGAFNDATCRTDTGAAKRGTVMDKIPPMPEDFRLGWEAGYYEACEGSCRMFKPSAQRSWEDVVYTRTHVPKLQTCRNCDGAGKFNDSGTCAVCGGKGQVRW